MSQQQTDDRTVAHDDEYYNEQYARFFAEAQEAVKQEIAANDRERTNKRESKN